MPFAYAKFACNEHKPEEWGTGFSMRSPIEKFKCKKYQFIQNHKPQTK